MWNRKHNEQEKISGHTFVKNWKLVNLPIKVHPSAEYCNSGGLKCQYLRFKDPDGKTNPFCAWNLEYRGIDARDDKGCSQKKPLQYDDKQKNFIRKARFCAHLGESYYANYGNSWENTTTVDDPDPMT
jgi:hypothetical protein